MGDEVSLEDQQNINQFGRLNDRVEGMKFQKSRIEMERENMADAEEELLLADDDVPVHYFIGGAFYLLTHEEAEERLKADTEKVEHELSLMDATLAATTKELAELKVVLKSKFKDKIQLDL